MAVSLRFGVLGSVLFAAKHGLLPLLAPPLQPLFVRVPAHATDAQVSGAVERALLIDTALAAGAAYADPVVREELLRSMRVWTEAPKDDVRLVREAVALGLHLDDAFVAERLATLGEQMLRAPQRNHPPSEATLRAYFTRHRARYAEDSRVTGTLLMVCGADAEARARALRRELRRVSLQDALAFHELPAVAPSFAGLARAGLAQRIGPSAAHAVFALSPGVWSEPLLTPYGYALVYVAASYAEKEGDFAQLRQRIAADYGFDTRLQQRATALAEARSKRAISLSREEP